MMAVPLCSLQGLHVHHPRLCSLQLLHDEQPFVPNQDEINLPDIFGNLDDDLDQDIDLNHYLDIINVDNKDNNDVLLPDIFGNLDDDFNYFDGPFLPTDSLTVRNHLLEAGVNVDNNDNNNDVLLLQQQKNIKSIPYYKSIKTHLNRVIKKGSFKDTISELVKKIHLLRMISTHVLKLYIIQKRKNYPNFDFTQIIKKTFIINLIEVIANLREIVPASTSSVERSRV